MNATLKALAEARLTQAEMDQRQADRALERANQLRPGGAISVQRIEEADTAAQVAKGRVLEARQVLAGARAGKRAQEIKLAHTRIEAPMAGIVSRRPARLGALSDGAPLFQLVGKGELELVGTVAQSAMAQIEAGQAVLVTLTDGRKFNGRVRQVAPAIDTSSQLGTVRIALPDAAGIPVGAAAVGAIETRQNSGLTIPQTSLLFENGGVFVFTVADGEARRRPIVLGPVAGGRARVLSGLGAGEAVVALAGAFLRDGDPVTAVLGPEDAGDPS
ncbi:efflux RND transporter periplasmic adaptor subunit [uncultured Martelella sp.]|uniref:efflux RND transporter periplasmic adaptor subunit n=1 Tax=uncultured Martelella sp. TaxID=392331 RepID=UPI0029C8EDE1|nr:efflux RND transporter periplasmic adaptor subunit [uncultured Martelella sp.]